jgi:hypothetical protein
MISLYSALCVLMLNIISPPHAERPHHRARFQATPVVVTLVWGVTLRRKCSRAVVLSIQNALRTFQYTRITNTSMCIAQPEKAFIAKLGCGHGVAIEVIKFASPVAFNDGMYEYSYGNGNVSEIIASMDRDYPGHPGHLHLGLGRARGGNRGPKTLYFNNVWSPVDFLRLRSGECSEASPSSDVPARV